MPVKLKPADDDFIPDVERRFLFDETAVQEQQQATKSGVATATKDLFKSEQAPFEDINDIVDRERSAVEAEAVHSLVAKMLPSTVFRGLILLLIIANAVIIGIQTDERLGKEYAYIFSILDQFVLTVFVVEIIFKWYYGFLIFWKVGWNILDFVIVAALLLGPAFQYLGSSRILRILRVLRAARSLRSISGLQGLSLVVQTVLQSLPDMFNIALVMCIILIVFAVAGITLFGKDIPEYFGDLSLAMFSLFICVTQDGWLAIFDAFKKAGEAQPWIEIAGMLYLILAITVGAFVFANLAVAAVVTNLELAMKEIKAENKADDALNDYVEQDEEVTHIPIVQAEEVTKNFEFSKQAPVHAPDLKNLVTVEKLENYMMILTALEENLAEYKSIREDLDKMFDVVCELNVQDKTETRQSKESEFSIQPHKSPVLNLNDMKKLKGGDLITNIMAISEQQNVQRPGHGSASASPLQSFTALGY